MVVEAARILIADDEETFARSMADLLRREGFRCEVVSDADGARAALARENFDVLVADIRMPGNQQFQLIHDIPGLAPGLPVIVVTAFPTLTSAVEAVELPVTGYLLKPVDVATLLERVREVSGRRRALRAVEEKRARLEAWLRDLDSTREAIAAGAMPPEASSDPCLLVGCPQRQNLLGMLREVIDVLQRTKGSFKSKELAALRKKVEQVVERATG